MPGKSRQRKKRTGNSSEDDSDFDATEFIEM